MTTKRVKILFLGLLFFILSCSSQALAIDLYGFGSYWDKNDVDGTWGGGIGLSLPLFTEHLRLDGRAYFFGSSDLGFGDNLTLTPLDLGLQVHILPAAKLDPYILGGVSYIYVDSNRIGVDSDFGAYFGGGLELALMESILKLFGEIVYRTSTLDTRFDTNIDVSGTTANIGLKLHF